MNKFSLADLKSIFRLNLGGQKPARPIQPQIRVGTHRGIPVWRDPPKPSRNIRPPPGSPGVRSAGQADAGDVMPIRPENRPRYPADWKAISQRIKDRAGWRCECEGECGRGTHDGRCPNRHGERAYKTVATIVVLTTAHLDHTPENVCEDNLKAMCQGCHLHYDREHHAQTAYRTRREGRAIDLFAEVT
jgi:hypothetical protein